MTRELPELALMRAAESALFNADSRASLEHAMQRLAAALPWRPCIWPVQTARYVDDDIVVRASVYSPSWTGYTVDAEAWVSGFRDRALVIHQPVHVTVTKTRASEIIPLVRRLVDPSMSNTQVLWWLADCIQPALLELPEFLRAIVDSAIECYVAAAAEATGIAEHHWRDALASLRGCVPVISREVSDGT